MYRLSHRSGQLAFARSRTTHLVSELLLDGFVGVRARGRDDATYDGDDMPAVAEIKLIVANDSRSRPRNQAHTPDSKCVA